jgi:dGTPase
VDRDRILHSKAFRRLNQKTQVFLAPRGDHYRTRLTHTLEVAQIARTLSSAMGLNESLTEAMALGHDLGHTPFGHAGEKVLNAMCPGGFHHARQSLRVVDVLERDGRGLNLTDEVREGISKHSKGKGSLLIPASTLESQVVRIADLIAYLNHDLDDALRAKVVTHDEIPKSVIMGLGGTHGGRISAVVSDVIETSLVCELDQIAPSSVVHDILLEFRTFLYDRVYDNPQVHADFIKASKLLAELFEYFMEHRDMFKSELAQDIKGCTIEELVTDFIAGMTDRYAIELYEKFFMPQPWKVL